MRRSDLFDSNSTHTHILTRTDMPCTTQAHMYPRMAGFHFKKTVMESPITVQKVSTSIISRIYSSQAANENGGECRL